MNKSRKETGKNKEKVLEYLRFVLKRWPRPKELRIGDLSRKLGLSYRQVRRIIDNLVEDKVIEKWTQYTPHLQAKCFYRFPDYLTMRERRALARVSEQAVDNSDRFYHPPVDK